MCGQALMSLSERGSMMSFLLTKMMSPKPQLAPKTTQRMVQLGTQSEAWNSTQAASCQRMRNWLYMRVRTIAIISGRLVKKYSRQGLAMLKAIMVTTQMLLMNTKRIFASRPRKKPSSLSQVAIATSMPPFSQQQSLLAAWKIAMKEICPATWMPKVANMVMRLVKLKRELLGFSMLSSLAVLVQPMKTMKKKLRQRSQQRYWKSPGYCRNFSDTTVVVYWISEQMAIMLNSVKLVASPALHSFISSTIEEMLATCEVKGAEIDASACDKDSPMSACFSAPQSFAPSPHIDTFMPMFWKAITIFALSLGLVRANTDTHRMNLCSSGVSSTMLPGKSSLKALPVMQSWLLVRPACWMMASMKEEVESLAILSRVSSSISCGRLTSSSSSFSSDTLLLPACSAGPGLPLTSVVPSSSSKLKFSSVNLPSTKSQMIIPFALLEMSHLQLILDPVSVLSPVIITQPISAALRVAIAPLVSGFSLFSNTSKPLKISYLSASALLMVFTSASGMGLLAIASTLNPCEAYWRSISLQLGGMVSLFMMVASISGEPLVYTSWPLVMLFLQTALIRCRSESNSKRRKTTPLCPRSLSKAKMTSGSECDWLREYLPKRKVLTSMGSPTSSCVASILMMELLAAILVRMVLRKGDLSQLSSILLMLGSLLKTAGQKRAWCAGTRAWKSMKSSVRVPVLSKQQNSIMPPVITLFWATQKILFFSSRSIAQMMPKVMLTGREGGTVIVIRSKNFCTRSTTSTYLWMRITSTMKVPTDRQKRKSRYLVDSRWKVFSCSFGKRMMRISCPLVVTKFVRTTHTGMPQASRKDQNLLIFFLSLTWMMVVPSYTKAFLSIGFSLLHTRSNESAFLTMGTDYPVSAHSLMRALPSRMMPSKGILMGSLRKTISPGTTSMEEMTSILPQRSTLTGISQQAMLKILLLSWIIWQRLMARPKSETKKSVPAKQQYFWLKVQQETEKMRKRQSGRRISRMVRSMQLGFSITIVPSPQVFLSSCACESLSPRSSRRDLSMWVSLSRQSYMLTRTTWCSSMMQCMQRLMKQVQKRLCWSSTMKTFCWRATMLACQSQLMMQKSVASSSPQNQQQNMRFMCGYLDYHHRYQKVTSHGMASRMFEIRKSVYRHPMNLMGEIQRITHSPSTSTLWQFRYTRPGCSSREQPAPSCPFIQIYYPPSTKSSHKPARTRPPRIQQPTRALLPPQRAYYRGKSCGKCKKAPTARRPFGKLGNGGE